MAGNPVNAGTNGGAQKPDIKQAAVKITEALGKSAEPIVEALAILHKDSQAAVDGVKGSANHAAAAAFEANEKAKTAISTAAEAGKSAKTASESVTALSSAVSTLEHAVQRISGKSDAAAKAASDATAAAAECNAAVGTIPRAVAAQVSNILTAEVSVLDGEGVKSVTKSGGDLVAYLSGEVSRLTGLLGTVVRELADLRNAFTKRVGDLETALGMATSNLEQAEAANAGLQEKLERVIERKVGDLAQDSEVHKGRLGKAEAALRTVLGDGYEAATVLNELAVQAISPLVVAALREDNYKEAVMAIAEAVGKGNTRAVLDIFVSEPDFSSIKLALAREKDIYYVSHLDRPENATIRANIENRAPKVQERAKECIVAVDAAVEAEKAAARKGVA